MPDSGGKGDFSKPIKPADPTRLGPAPVPTNFADTSGRRIDGGGLIAGGGHVASSGSLGGGTNASLSVGLGIGAGISFTANHWFGSHSFINFSFNTSFCDYDPWVSPGYCWYRPHFWHHHHWRHRHHHFDPFWHCNPWGGFYYSRSCYPLTWCYPGYTWSAHPCGSYFRISYYRPHCHWLTSFSYCDTPCATFSDCWLISPTVVVAAYDPPEVCWSPTTIYRHTYIPVYSEAPAPSLVFVDDTLPAPASASELAVTTERELADTYMKLGDIESALRVYSAHIARHPGDVLAVRALGFALIDRGETERGVEHVERAYRIDPTLAKEPYERELLREPDNLIVVLDRATALATTSGGKSGAAAAWLTVAVLMQADGRDGPAREALDKAKEAGLSPKVVQEMQAAVPVS